MALILKYVCSNFWKRFTCGTYTELKAGLPLFKSEPNLIIRHAEKISMSKSGWTIFPSLNVRATIMESGRASFLKTALLQKQTDLLDLYLVI
jgi:hypothetical protein